MAPPSTTASGDAGVGQLDLGTGATGKRHRVAVVVETGNTHVRRLLVEAAVNASHHRARYCIGAVMGHGGTRHR